MKFTRADVHLSPIVAADDQDQSLQRFMLVSMTLKVEGVAEPDRCGIVFPLKYIHSDGVVYKRVVDLPPIADIKVETPDGTFAATCVMTDDHHVQISIHPTYISKPTPILFTGVLRWGSRREDDDEDDKLSRGQKRKLEDILAQSFDECQTQKAVHHLDAPTYIRCYDLIETTLNQHLYIPIQICPAIIRWSWQNGNLIWYRRSVCRYICGQEAEKRTDELLDELVDLSQGIYLYHLLKQLEQVWTGTVDRWKDRVLGWYDATLASKPHSAGLLVLFYYCVEMFDADSWTSDNIILNAIETNNLELVVAVVHQYSRRQQQICHIGVLQQVCQLVDRAHMLKHILEVTLPEIITIPFVVEYCRPLTFLRLVVQYKCRQSPSDQHQSFLDRLLMQISATGFVRSIEYLLYSGANPLYQNSLIQIVSRNRENLTRASIQAAIDQNDSVDTSEDHTQIEDYNESEDEEDPDCGTEMSTADDGGSLTEIAVQLVSHAAQNGYNHSLQIIVEMGWQRWITRQMIHTAFMAAVRHNQVASCRLLLECGVDLNQVAVEALTISSRRGYGAIICMIFDSGYLPEEWIMRILLLNKHFKLAQMLIAAYGASTEHLEHLLPRNRRRLSVC